MKIQQLFLVVFVAILTISCNIESKDAFSGAGQVKQSQDLKGQDGSEEIEGSIVIETYFPSDRDGVEQEVELDPPGEVVNVPPLKEIEVLFCHAWRNPANPFDVNADGSVSSLDALNVINSISRDGVRALDNEINQSNFYYDVNGDCRITALDALLVLNQLSGAGRGLRPEKCTPYYNAWRYSHGDLVRENAGPLDVNDNGTVDQQDYDLLKEFLSTEGPKMLSQTAENTFGIFPDTNGDCILDYADLNRIGEYLELEELHSPWKNPHEALDVNGDGKLDNWDLFVIQKKLDEKGAHPLPAQKTDEAAHFPDVDGDGWVTGQDFQMVLDNLKSKQ